MTRQYAYQQRHRAAGLCLNCKLPVVQGPFCARHALRYRQWQRERRGFRAWKAGNPGAPPRISDAELRAMARVANGTDR
jgi:hypothetical protein